MAKHVLRSVTLALCGTAILAWVVSACSDTVTGTSWDGSAGQGGGAGEINGGAGSGSSDGKGTGGKGSGGKGNGTGSSSGDGGSGASDGGSGGTSSNAPQPCKPTDVPTSAVFVDVTNGLDEANDLGSRSLPLKTLSKALTVAAGRELKDIVVAQGTYPEALQLKGVHSGIRISGGYTHGEDGWVRDCEGDWASKTVIDSGAATGIRITGITSPVELWGLTVKTKETGATTADQDGESLYGVRIEYSTVRLRNVAVVAGRAGDGGEVTASAHAGNRACDGLTTCSSSPTVGADGDAVAASSSPGTFTDTGFVPSSGPNGSPGQPGTDGVVGAAGETATTCAAPNSPQCSTPGGYCPCNYSTASAGTGKCGCGGLGGNAGAAGRGGGASVGVFIVGAASTVSLIDSSIVSGDGGNGSLGGLGGNGGPGTTGSTGIGGVCDRFECGSFSLDGGAAGTPGRHGGNGTQGGAGAGGSSYALVRVEGASVLLSGEYEFEPGAAGMGATGASAGDSAIELEVE